MGQVAPVFMELPGFETVPPVIVDPNDADQGDGQAESAVAHQAVPGGGLGSEEETEKEEAEIVGKARVVVDQVVGIGKS